MKKYEKTILNYLLDKYEKSKSFIGSNQVNQSFSVKIVKLFPEYADDAEYDIFCAVNDAVSILETHGYIKVKRAKNEVIQEVSLNLCVLENAYSYISRTPKKDVMEEIKKVLLKYKDSNEILSFYCSSQLDRISQNKTVQHFNGDLTVFEDVLKAIAKITEVKAEIYEREFSVQVFGDSKKFEDVRTQVQSILFEYGDFPNKEMLLANLNIVKNPGYIYFKGQGRLTIDNQMIDFSNIHGGLAISSDDLKNVRSIEILGKSVMTIENLTTFSSFNSEDCFVIYLGGFHNTPRRDFICKVFKQNPDKNYLHYGDIDAGGLYILQHLRRKTGINFLPFCMDVKTLSDNLQYSKPLTENDRKRLLPLIETEFDEVVDYMLKNNCKLEQEAIHFAQ